MDAIRRGRRDRAAAAAGRRGGVSARKPSKGLGRDAPIEERAPQIIRILSEAYPDAKVALNFSTPLEMLVATILSAQCTDGKVNEVTETLFQKYRTAEDYLKVPEDELKADIKPTGFFNQKATSIREACRRIVEVYGGQVPDTMEDLITLRGVARKTANIVLGNAFGKVEGIAVDTHVKRLANRLGFSQESDPDKIEQDLMRRIPRERWFDFTYVLIDHGRAVCVARKPKGEVCPVNHLCAPRLVRMARGPRFPDDAFPIVVAHRGASSTRPENTIPSFEEAIRLGAGIVEFDVRLSRDGVPVVIHDPAVDRTTDGTGLVHELGVAGR